MMAPQLMQPSLNHPSSPILKSSEVKNPVENTETTVKKKKKKTKSEENQVENTEMAVEKIKKKEKSETNPTENTETTVEKKKKKKKSENAIGTPFRRINEEAIEVKSKFSNNSFEAKSGAQGSWGEKANKDLLYTQGKSFKHEKTKKRRGSYRGGAIDNGVHSVKFDSD